MDLPELEDEIKKIKDRNGRVEADKAWELSWTRKLFIAVLTYFAAALLLILLGIDKPWLSALVPSIAFVLSTLSIAVVKNIWLKTFQTNKRN